MEVDSPECCLPFASGKMSFVSDSVYWACGGVSIFGLDRFLPQLICLGLCYNLSFYQKFKIPLFML